MDQQQTPAPAQAAHQGSLLNAQPTASPQVPVTPSEPIVQAAPVAPTVNGQQVASWKDSLPEDLRNDPGLAPINDISSLAKSFVNAQKMIGKDKVILPDQHASEEDWTRFFQKVGLPETLDKYNVNLPKDTKYVDPETLNELKPLALKLGVLPKQLEGILGWYEQHSGKLMGQTEEQAFQQRAQKVEGLKKEWGEAFETKLSWVNRLLDENNIEGLDELRNDPNIGTNPAFIKFLAKVGEGLYKEDTIKGAGDNARFVLTPGEATERIGAIQGNPDHPYHNSNHANHDAAVKEMEGLFNAAYRS